MLCWYSYREGEKEFGEYQCDTDDFKQFFKHRKNHIDDIVVKLQNGQVWIWYYVKKFGKGIWCKAKS